MLSVRDTFAQLSAVGLTPLGPGVIDPARVAAPGGPVEAFADIVNIVNAKAVIEVGSWEGRSASLWGQLLSARSSDWFLICVDTWLGSFEMWQRASGDWSRERLQLRDGYPSVFSTFTSTIRRAGFENHIIALPLDSGQGLELLQHQGVRADIVYVDAAHDFTNALRDIRQAHLLINIDNPRSLVLCDDFMTLWAGVREAVFASADETGARVYVKHSQAALVPSRAGESMIAELVTAGWKDARHESSSHVTAPNADSVERLTREVREMSMKLGKANSDLRIQRAKFRELKSTVRELRKLVRELRAGNARAHGYRSEEGDRVHAELATILNSRSWKMTAWARNLSMWLRSRR